MPRNEKLTAAYWNSKKSIIEAAVKGFNPLIELPKLLQEAYPDLKIVTMGFFSEGDIQEMSSMGWELLTKGVLDPDEFNNSAIPARFGLTDDGSGALKWRDNYIMFMHKKHREALEAARQQKHEDGFVESISDRKHTMKGDPRASEMSDYSESTYQSKRVQPTPSTAEPKRKPGRPPKKK